VFVRDFNLTSVGVIAILMLLVYDVRVTSVSKNKLVQKLLGGNGC